MYMRNKKNMVIGLLCVALVFMGIGYSLLQSTLNISGTAKSTGSFNVQITNITMKEKSNNNVTDTTEYPGYTNGGKDANLSAKPNVQSTSVDMTKAPEPPV